MGRIILLILIALAIYWLFRAFLRSQSRDDDNAPKQPPASQTPKGEDMVTCTRCGVNLPRSDARDEAGKLVCANNPGCRHPA